MRPSSSGPPCALLARPLVIGASGLVGGAFHARLAAGGYAVTGTYRANARPSLERFELAGDSPALLERLQPSAVVLASALTHVDYCESHEAETLERNVGQVRPVAAWCSSHGVPLVYFSTDYVFDGAAGPYDEDAPTRPLNVYGRSKLLAEQVVASCPRHVVLRITNVFDIGFDDRNFLHRCVTSLRDGQSLVVPSDQLATPTYATWLADQTVRLVEAGRLLADGSPQRLHASCDDLVSRADFARRVASRLGADPALITLRTTADLHQPAPRPLRAGLRNRRWKALLGVERLPLDEALDDCLPRLRRLYARTL